MADPLGRWLEAPGGPLTCRKLEYTLNRKDSAWSENEAATQSSPSPLHFPTNCTEMDKDKRYKLPKLPGLNPAHSCRPLPSTKHAEGLTLTSCINQPPSVIYLLSPVASPRDPKPPLFILSLLWKRTLCANVALYKSELDTPPWQPLTPSMSPRKNCTYWWGLECFSLGNWPLQPRKRLK